MFLRGWFFWIRSRHAARTIDSALEGFDGKAGDVPLCEPGGGEEVCVWTGREGKAADVHADV